MHFSFHDYSTHIAMPIARYKNEAGSTREMVRCLHCAIVIAQNSFVLSISFFYNICFNYKMANEIQLVNAGTVKGVATEAAGGNGDDEGG